jgi:hypothetical protein
MILMQRSSQSFTNGNISQSSLNSGEERVELPSWIFDVDDNDEEDETRTSLLQELEIDPTHIYRFVHLTLSKIIGS